MLLREQRFGFSSAAKKKAYCEQDAGAQRCEPPVKVNDSHRMITAACR
jgi:hypothetical protein